MERTLKQQNAIRWIWADLVSSYRFWGLLTFSLFVAATNNTFPFLVVTSEYHLYKMSNSLQMAVMVGYLFSIIPAWIACRAKSYYLLYTFAFLSIVTLFGVYYYLDKKLMVFMLLSSGFYSSNLN